MAAARWTAAISFVQILLILGIGAAAAQDAPPSLPGIIGPDDRQSIPSAEWPWSAIGRINRAGVAHCTGTLIAANQVLTTAHCLYDWQRRRWPPPSSLHFLAGYSRDTYLAHRRGSELVLAPGYRPTREPDLSVAADDVAILVLDAAVDIRPLPLAGGDGIAERVVQAGYSQDRAHILSIDEGCRIVGPTLGGRLLLHDCDATRGDSGSPLLIVDDREARLAAVHVGVATADGRPFGVAVPVAGLPGRLSPTPAEPPDQSTPR